MSEPGDLPRALVRELNDTAHPRARSDVKRLVAEGYAAFSDGEYEAAIQALARAKPQAPRSATIREMLGLSHYHLGAFRDAARELSAYRRMSGSHHHDPVLADAHRGLGRSEKALSVLDETPLDELDDDVVSEAAIVRAGALRDLGRLDEAVTVLRTAADDASGPQPRLWYALADALEAHGGRADARSWWDAIYAEDPDFFDVAERRVGVKRS